MDYVIVKTVRNSGKCFRSTDTNRGMETRHKTMKNAEKQVTIMLLLVTTLFFILLCPTYVRFVYLVFATRDTPLDYANYILFVQVTYIVYMLRFYFMFQTVGYVGVSRGYTDYHQGRAIHMADSRIH